MNALKWWSRIVGSLYLIEGVGLTAQAWLVPAEFAANWASVPAATLDPIAVRGMVVAGMPGVLTWALLGAMLWIFSSAPAKARMLVMVVVAWELLVWAPLDVIGLFNGFEIGRAAALLAIHAAIGISGILVLRSTPSAGQAEVAAAVR
jgi:hypothetical protein